VTIRNTGSEAIDRVWVNTSTPTSDPFGSSDPTDFNAGNFFQINISESVFSKFPDTTTPEATSSYHYVNRVEYMFQGESEVPNFIVAPNGTGEVTIGSDGNTDPSEIERGVLRAGGEERYFVILEASSAGGGCDGSDDARIRIGNTPFTSGQQGTIDFTDDGPEQQDADYTAFTISEAQSGNGIGVVDPDSNNLVTIGDRNYELLTSCDTAPGIADNEENVLRTRYNPTALSFNDLNSDGNAEFIFSASTEGNSIQPSQFLTLDTAVEVPRGVTQGDLATGTFRVYVTSDNQA
jgi:hypothetical protein